MSKVTQVYTFKNLQRVPETEVRAGSIVAVAGIENAGIGDTLADPGRPAAPAADQGGRADGAHDVCRQRQSLCRPRRDST